MKVTNSCTTSLNRQFIKKKKKKEGHGRDPEQKKELDGTKKLI